MTGERNITLRKGLEEFYKENKSHLSFSEEAISSESQAFFKTHDITYALFGCDTSLFSEGSVKIWTIFGTTLGFWEHIRAYKRANAFELSRNFSLSHFVSNIFKLFLSIPVLIIRAKNMYKLWPWTEFEPYLDAPISEIRKEFNIHVL